MFDVSKQVEFKRRNGTKIGDFRFPTDAEAMERQRKRKLIVKQLGRNMSETIAPDSSEYDAEFIKMLSPDVEIDGYEAGKIIDELCKADIDEITQEGDCFRVSLRVCGGIMTEHVVAMPNAKQIFKYRRGAFHRLDIGNKQQITINLQAADDLDREIRKESIGYAGDVPLYHRAEVVRGVVEHIEAGFGAAGDENF
jgi:hypothetical protein